MCLKVSLEDKKSPVPEGGDNKTCLASTLADCTKGGRIIF